MSYKSVEIINKLRVEDHHIDQGFSTYGTRNP